MHGACQRKGAQNCSLASCIRKSFSRIQSEYFFVERKFEDGFTKSSPCILESSPKQLTQ
jgi:hypothetical protein